MIGKPSYKTEVDYQIAGIATIDVVSSFTFIPDNTQGVRPGYYHHRDLVALLRSACRRPATVRFIADMME